MNQKTMFTRDITMHEFWLCRVDEVDIEERLISEVSTPAQDVFIECAEAMKSTLRCIDALKIGGTYDQERKLLEPKIARAEQEAYENFSKMNPGFEGNLDRTPDPKDMAALENYLSGLNSKDPKQRKRFRNLSETPDFKKKNLQEALPFLNVLEKAQKLSGRPSVSPPWRNIVHALDEMRLIIAEQQESPKINFVGSDRTVPWAARVVAEREGNATVESRIKRYAKEFRSRVALRD